MSTIIAGRFESSERADHAVETLVSRSIARDDISVFFVTPAGQHDSTPIGGDEDESPGTEQATHGAGTGALLGAGVGVAGALIAATAGLAAPMVVVAGLGAAAAGAYSGSLAGAMGATMDAGHRAIRHAGMMVAVNSGNAGNESEVIGALREAGAVDLERCEGSWSDGDWSDFDPTKPPHLIDAASSAASSERAPT